MGVARVLQNLIEGVLVSIEVLQLLKSHELICCTSGAWNTDKLRSV